jgi:Carboxypeptidase regulatory-like domain
MRNWRPGPLVVLACVAMIVLPSAGCGTRPQPSPCAESGVLGRMIVRGGMVSGARPVPRVTIEVHQGDRTGTVVATVTSDAKGRFKVDLPPGDYTIVPTKNPRANQAVVPAAATVKPGTYARVTVGFSISGP